MSANYSGTRLPPGATTTIHTGSGEIRALLLSHNQATVQTVTIYDNTVGSGTVRFQITLPPNPAPFYAEFRAGALAFATGLCVVMPANVDGSIWAVGK